MPSLNIVGLLKKKKKEQKEAKEAAIAEGNQVKAPFSATSLSHGQQAAAVSTPTSPTTSTAASQASRPAAGQQQQEQQEQEKHQPEQKPEQQPEQQHQGQSQPQERHDEKQQQEPQERPQQVQQPDKPQPTQQPAQQSRLQSQQNQDQQETASTTTAPPSTDISPGMNPVSVQQPPYHNNPHQGQQPPPSESQKSLPSISNLINPQTDGSNHAQPNSSYLNQPSSQTPHSASPGTEPDVQKLQQQQAQSAMQQPPQHQQPPQPNQQQQTQSQGHVQQGARQTKGKYTLTDFDLLRTVGTGSFGRVHLVQSKHNQRFYAIKVLKKAQVVKMKQVEHTNDERRMLAEVKHPFLLTLWGTFQDCKNLYMVMDFVEGGELFSLLRKSGRFPNPVAKFYAAEVTLSLEYLHSKNIIYRDLKPENLLLDRHGHLKITDFGFAKRVPDKTWTLCGTPDYLAPEVVSNKGYNKSVDWWSLGILVYEMLCGYTPFWDSGSPMKIYENILRGKVKYPQYMDPGARDLLEKLITPDLSKRLGNLYGGSQDVKNHPWFAEVTWERLAKKDIDAPYTPPVKGGTGDASQFDRYPEETDRYGATTGEDE